MFFSTRNKDNDRILEHCSVFSNGKSGGWYNACSKINYNGIYPTGPGQESGHLLRWKGWKGNQGLKSFSMAIKVVEN